MNNAIKIASLVALIFVIAPSLLFLAGAISLEAVKWAALIGTVGWFIATPIWMSRTVKAEVVSDAATGATSVEA